MTKEEKKEYDKIRYKKNKNKIKENVKKYQKENFDKVKEYQKKYSKENCEEINNYSKQYRENNIEKEKRRNKKYREKNKIKTKIRHKKYRETYKKDINKRVRTKLKNDHIFKLKLNIRTLIRNSIKKNGYIKTNKTEVMLGCSFEYFKLHLESKFEPWMNWDNHGSINGQHPTSINQCWDIDHIIKLETAKTKEEVIKLNHFNNLQPLCSYTNRWIKR